MVRTTPCLGAVNLRTLAFHWRSTVIVPACKSICSQIYSNEPWHYELRPEAIDHGCPPMYADPTQDPRMQQ